MTGKDFLLRWKIELCLTAQETEIAIPTFG